MFKSNMTKQQTHPPAPCKTIKHNNAVIQSLNQHFFTSLIKCMYHMSGIFVK